MSAIPPNVLSNLLAESVGAQSIIINEIKSNSVNSNNIARLATIKKYDELGSTESRAVDKVLNLPGE